jgi:hypothetical protein
MDPVSAIAGAIIAGATVAAQDTTQVAIKDAYNALKTLVIKLYGLTTITTLEKNPTAPAFQEGLRQEISDTPAILDNKEILDRVKALQEVLKSQPPAKLEGWGLVAKDIEAASDIVLERISGETGGGQVGSITSKQGGIRISDVHGGKYHEKK